MDIIVNTFKGFFSNFAYLLKKLMKSDKKLFWICFCMITVGLLIPLSNVFFPKFIIWAAIQDMQSGALLIGIILFFFVITSVCNGIQNYYVRRNNFYLSNFGFKLREDIQEISMTMPFPMTEDSRTLDKIKLAEGCISRTKPIIEGFCRCISATILLCCYAILIARLSLWVLLIFAISIFLNVLVIKSAKRYEIENREPLAKIERKKGYLFQTMFDYRFGKELRLFNLTEVLADKFDIQKKDKYTINSRIESKATQSNGLEGLLGFVCELTIYIFLLLAYLNKGLSVDDFVLYTGLAASFHLISKGFIGDIASLISLNVSIADYRGFVEGSYQSDTTQKRESKKCEKNEIPEIVFDKVCFRYPGTEHNILEDLSFVLESGRHTSIVGVNGAGKSTIVKLICRLYCPDSGKILLDNRDIWEYTQQEYMEKISAVFQESRLFACSIAENISLEESFDNQKMWEALRVVGMEDKIRSLKDGVQANTLKHLYEDGVEFSGGEAQRLCIARAVYKQSDILLLDEPTAALDALAEKSIYESFSKISRGKTTVFISHRLNSNRFCDKVIYLEDGRILSQGTHEQLMESCAPYHELYQLQAQYYQTEGVAQK